MTKTILVLGATGGLGRETARIFAANGWTVRILHRNPQTAIENYPVLKNMQMFKGDAMSEQDVLTASKGVDLILHSVNPPNYQKWRELALPMLSNTIKAARENNARIIFPGNIYVFHPDAGNILTEHTPQNPATRKGKVRVEMENMLQQAANKGARSLIIRAPDFFSADAPSSWFENMLVKRGKPVKTITYPDNLETGHSWAYLPDLAKTIFKIAEMEKQLPAFDTYNFRGYYFDKGSDFLEIIKKAAGKPKARVSTFPWAPITLLSPFVSLFRELREMRYLWKIPHQLDNTKLVALLGTEPQTPIDQAVKESLRGLKCI